MIEIENIKKEIVERLMPLNPRKIILFGSYAYGNPSEGSDIDLYIVTKDNFMPNSWRQKKDIVKKISLKLNDIRIKYDIDLIVHTLPMHKKFINMDSLFSKEIINKGNYLYG